MTLAESTPSRTRRERSAVEPVDWWQVARFAVWVVLCVLLIVLA